MDNNYYSIENKLFTLDISAFPIWEDKFPHFPGIIEEAVTRTFAHLNKEFNKKISISFLLCDNSTIINLNNEFRGKNQPTNVLSFPADEEFLEEENDEHILLGDIAISYEYSYNEAVDLGIDFKDHFIHLVIHGLLHILDFDHIDDNDAKIMQNLEVEILADFKISNPYE